MRLLWQRGAQSPMRLIIANLPNEAFEAVRTELSRLGVLRMTIAQVYGTSPRAPATLRYRGAPLPSHLRAEVRLECVVADEDSSELIAVLRGRMGPYGQVAVLEVRELHEAQRLDANAYLDDPRLDIARR